jgi:hypothetical protein
LSQLLLLQTSINLSRYMYIFWLKNPASFQDDFWTYFLNIWIGGFSYISQLIFSYLPGKQPINFYIFSGKNPFDDDNKPRKFNIPSITIVLACAIIHVLVHIRIFVYKMKAKGIVTEQNLIKQKKTLFIKTLETQTLTDFTIFTGVLIGFGGLVKIVIKLSTLEPKELNEYPNYLMIYWMNLVNSLFFSLLMVGLCYWKNNAMRHMMTREIKDLLLNCTQHH